MHMIQVKCLGFYDEEDDECATHCEHVTECRLKRTQEVTRLYTTLLTQSKTSAVTTPIFNHFKQVFEQIEGETLEKLETIISRECLKWDQIPTWNPHNTPIIFKR